jgi:hypothetical protein
MANDTAAEETSSAEHGDDVVAHGLSGDLDADIAIL